MSWRERFETRCRSLLGTLDDPHSIIGIMLWHWKQRRKEIQLFIIFIIFLLALVKAVVKPWICVKDLV
jgi:hypothetical protein